MPDHVSVLVEAMDSCLGGSSLFVLFFRSSRQIPLKQIILPRVTPYLHTDGAFVMNLTVFVCL